MNINLEECIKKITRTMAPNLKEAVDDKIELFRASKVSIYNSSSSAAAIVYLGCYDVSFVPMKNILTLFILDGQNATLEDMRKMVYYYRKKLRKKIIIQNGHKELKE